MPRVRINCTDLSSQRRDLPEFFHVTNINKLTNTLHGDGFFPFKGTEIIDGVEHTRKSLNGEVIPGDGLTIKVRDYVALIDGVMVVRPPARIVFAEKFFTTIDVSSVVGTAKYLLLEPYHEIDNDGNIHKTHDRGTFTLSDTPAEVDSGKITVAKITLASGATSVTENDIDNSIKDYLKDVDLLYKEFNDAINQLKVDLYDELIAEFEEFKTEITGDITAINNQLAVINATITILQLRVTVNESDIQNLYAQIQSLNDLIYTVVADQIATLSQELQDAITNLSGAISDNALEIDLLKTKVSAAEGIITVLQQEVEATTTGLLDRMNVVENTISDKANQTDLDVLENRVSNNEGVLNFLHPGPISVGYNMNFWNDIDGANSSNYKVSEEGIELSITAPSPSFEDDFNIPDGAVDLTKWDVTGLPIIESNKVKLPKNSSLYTKIGTYDVYTFEFDRKLDPTAYDQYKRDYLQMFIRDDKAGTRYEVKSFFIIDPNDNKTITGQSNIVYKFVGGVLKHWGYFGGTSSFNGMDATQQTFHYKVQSGNGLVKIWINGILTLEYIDYNIGGVGPITTPGFLRLYCGPYSINWIDNFKLFTSAGTYATSGIVQSNQLQSVDPIAQAYVEANVQYPGTEVGATRIMEDLFDGSDISAGWNQYIGSRDITVANGILTINPNGYQYYEWTPNLLTFPTTIEAKFRMEGQVNLGGIAMFGVKSSNHAAYIWIDTWHNGKVNFYDGVQMYNSLNYYVSPGEWVVGRIRFSDATHGIAEVWNADETIRFGSYNFTLSFTPVSIMIGIAIGVSGQRISFDRVTMFDGDITNTIYGNVTFDISLDGGANWITGYTLGSAIDGFVAPWNGAGNNILVRANLSTTDTNHTPRITEIRVNSTSGVPADKYLDLKTKINEIIGRINDETTPLEPDITTL